MSKRLTDEELQAIRERAEKATEGPWRIGKQSPNGLNNIGTVGGLLTAQTTDESNATFIAHARQDIPKLLAEIEDLRDGMKHFIENYHTYDSPENMARDARYYIYGEEENE